MKRVSFKVAQALKEVVYPQEWNDAEFYYTENGELKRSDDYEGNSVEDIMYYQRYAVAAPYYVEVWLWLWREKGLRLSVEYTRATETEYESWCTLNQEHLCNLPVSNGDPEEAIEKTIEYLVDNDLL